MSLPKTRYTPILAKALPAEEILTVYHQLVEENTLRWLFFSGECASFEDFVELVRNDNTLFYIVVDMKTKDLVSVFWLNGRTSINCGIHVAFFKKYFGKAVSISKEILKGLFEELKFLESLLCFIPTTNRIANKFAERVGWQRVGTIPKLIRDSKTLDIVSGEMYYLTKDEVT
jgi:L-amino acid N-acyltransferase YncA